MTIVALRAGLDVWHQKHTGQLSGRLASLIEHGILASVPEPFDPMERAFHVFGEARLSGKRPFAERTLKWEYGLRPDLLAVANVWEQAGHGALIVAAKGAPSPRSAVFRAKIAHERARQPMTWRAKACEYSAWRRPPYPPIAHGRIPHAASRLSTWALSGSQIRCVRQSPRRSRSAKPSASGSS